MNSFPSVAYGGWLATALGNSMSTRIDQWVATEATNLLVWVQIYAHELSVFITICRLLALERCCCLSCYVEPQCEISLSRLEKLDLFSASQDATGPISNLWGERDGSNGWGLVVVKVGSYCALVNNGDRNVNGAIAAVLSELNSIFSSSSLSLSTGFGKSLIYQVAQLVEKKSENPVLSVPDGSFVWSPFYFFF